MLITTMVLATSAILAAAPDDIARDAVAQWPVAKASTGAALGLDDPHRADINGKVWIGRPLIGGVDTGDKATSHASEYGAYDERTGRVYISVPGLFPFQTSIVTAIDPWQKQNDRSTVRNDWSNPYSNAHNKLADRLEEARQAWLKDNGYVGGVRTFVNDATLYRTKPENAPQSNGEGKIEPRATIQLSPDAARRSRPLRVEAYERVPVKAGEQRTAAVGDRISVPLGARAGTAEALRGESATTTVTASR
jgi:hypothetical protein